MLALRLQLHRNPSRPGIKGVGLKNGGKWRHTQIKSPFPPISKPIPQFWAPRVPLRKIPCIRVRVKGLG